MRDWQLLAEIRSGGTTTCDKDASLFASSFLHRERAWHDHLRGNCDLSSGSLRQTHMPGQQSSLGRGTLQARTLEDQFRHS